MVGSTTHPVTYMHVPDDEGIETQHQGVSALVPHLLLTCMSPMMRGLKRGAKDGQAPVTIFVAYMHVPDDEGIET